MIKNSVDHVMENGRRITLYAAVIATLVAATGTLTSSLYHAATTTELTVRKLNTTLPSSERSKASDQLEDLIENRFKALIPFYSIFSNRYG